MAEVVVEDVRGVGPERRAHVRRQRGLGELGDVVPQLPGVVPPGEVRVALREADLGQLGHHGGVGEGLGQEHDVRVAALDVGDHPGPERQRLGVRVVDPEGPDAVRDPVLEDVAARRPEGDAVGVLGRPEVDRVDVLVLLGRVLGVPDRAVGPLGEPLRVAAHPGVVGAALQRVVERDLEAELGGGGDEGVEVRHASRARGRRRRGRPSADPIAQGLPGSSADGVRLLSRPLRWVTPMGWMGGR